MRDRTPVIQTKGSARGPNTAVKVTDGANPTFVNCTFENFGTAIDVVDGQVTSVGNSFENCDVGYKLGKGTVNSEHNSFREVQDVVEKSK